MASLKLAELNIIQKLAESPVEGESPTAEYTSAIGYVLSIRGNVDKQRVSLAAHRQALDEYMWEVDNESLAQVINESGLFDVETDDNEKKESKK